MVVTVRDDERDGPAFVVGDVHGHLDKLISALNRVGSSTTAANWTGGRDSLWFLGDFVDRGPDGIGVIELVMRLGDEQRGQAARCTLCSATTRCCCWGMHLFGDTPVPSDFGFRASRVAGISTAAVVRPEQADRPACAVVDRSSGRCGGEGQPAAALRHPRRT